MHKILRSFVSAVLLLLTTVLTASAGGWAVITLDELPAQVTVGQPLTLGFTVRQHGRTLRDDLQPLLQFSRADVPESFTVTAQREGASGHYTASVTFPSGGQWTWRVDLEQFGMITQDMPPLAVSTAAVMVNTPASNALPVATALLSLIGAGTGLVLWLRTRARWTLALIGVAVLIGVGGLIAASSNTVFATAPAQPDYTTLAHRGKALFSAKGCAMCHAHSAVAAHPVWIGAEPPNLSQKTYGAEYLRLWLHDPQAVKPQTLMPKLELNDQEIEALIAFLQAAH